MQKKEGRMAKRERPRGKVLKFDAAGPGLTKTGDPEGLRARENVRFMRLQFTDILGVIKNVEIPSSQFAKALGRRDPVRRLLDRGIHADRRVGHEPRGRTYDIVRDLSVGAHGGEKVGRLICDVYNPDGSALRGMPAT